MGANSVLGFGHDLQTTDGDNGRVLNVESVSTAPAVGALPAGHIFTNLDNGTTANATGDYSVTPEYFEFIADAPCEIHRMMVYIQGAGQLQAEGYGTIAGGLTNGVYLNITESDNTEIFAITARPVFTNSTWSAYCYDAQPQTYGTGDNGLSVRWTFAKSGQPFYLTTGQKMRCLLNDDFSSQTLHTFHIQGVYV